MQDFGTLKLNLSTMINQLEVLIIKIQEKFKFESSIFNDISFLNEYGPLHPNIITKTDKVPTDEVLGQYLSKKIKIYLNSIQEFAKFLNNNQTLCNVDDLVFIVVLHELGHYWFHKEQLVHMKTPPCHGDKIGEWIAQMFVLYYIEDRMDLFIGISNNNQPESYNLNNRYRRMPLELYIELAKEVAQEETLFNDWDEIENPLIININRWWNVKDESNFNSIVKKIESQPKGFRTFKRINEEYGDDLKGIIDSEKYNL
ncbi:MAG: hypothetical protein WC388_00405 [Bacteroidales bacterium]|jgi:hypothetical protein